MGVEIKITFGRKMGSIFLITYLPTILMNIINTVTSFFEDIKFEGDIIKVNMTCMMVLSAMYISVSNSLPTTSEIKFVEIWLLFSLAYPFCIILTQVFIQNAKIAEKIKTKNDSHTTQEIEEAWIAKSEKKINSKNVSMVKIGQFLSRVVIPLTGIMFGIVYFSYGFLC